MTKEGSPGEGILGCPYNMTGFTHSTVGASWRNEAGSHFHAKNLLLFLAGGGIKVDPDRQKGAQPSNEGHHLVKKGPTEGH